MAEEFAPEVVAAYEQVKKKAEEGGYRLNPDRAFTLRLIQGLLDNGKRYGYWVCPCRLAFGDKARDIDLVCPCYYRDSDLEEHGACYCALYVTEDWIAGRRPHKSIPERRPEKFTFEGYSEPPVASPRSPILSVLPYPVWRCKVCGYLAARPEPPGRCPVCTAGKERFERFM